MKDTDTTADRLTGWSASSIRLPNGIVFENLVVHDSAGQAALSATLATLMGVSSVQPGGVQVARFNGAALQPDGLTERCPPESMLSSPPPAAPAAPITVPATPDTAPSSTQPAGTKSNPLLATWFREYLDERALGGLAEKTLGEAEWVLCDLLLGVCDNKPLREFDIADRDAVFDALKRWPAGARKKPMYKGLTVKEIIALGEKNNAPRLQARTIEKYLDRVRTCFRTALDRKYCGENLFYKLHLMDKKKRQKTNRQPFTEGELKRLFDPALRKKTCATVPHKFWGPLIALYGVMRVTEIGQLYVDDVYQIGVTWVFRIVDVRADQHLKNEESRRVVPVHQQLLDLGLLDYLDDVKQAGFDRLFPGLPYNSKNHYGHGLSRWFNEGYLRSLKKKGKAPRAGIDDPAKVLHSFRYVGANGLRSLTVDRIAVAEITGHERGQDCLTAVYLTPAEVEQRAALLNRLRFPYLSFAPYRRGQFSGYFKRLKRKQDAQRRHEAAKARRDTRG